MKIQPTKFKKAKSVRSLFGARVVWSVVLAVGAGSGVSACTKLSSIGEKATQEVSAQSIESLKTQGKNAEASAQLSRVAEVLFAPATLPEAEIVTDQALALNPKSNRAKFMKAMLGVVTPLRGILAMIPADPASKTKRELEYRSDQPISLINLQTGVCADPNTSESSRRYFCEIVEGQRIAKSYQQWNRHLRENVMPKVQEAYGQLKEIQASLDRSGEVVEIFGDYRWLGLPYHGAVIEQCVVEDGMLQFQCVLDISQSGAFFVDSADVRVLAGGVGSFLTAMQLQTAYSWDGYEQIVEYYQRMLESNRMRAYHHGNSAQTMNEMLIQRTRKERPFLVLEQDHQLDQIAAQITEMGMNLISVRELNSHLCESLERQGSKQLFKSVCLRSRTTDPEVFRSQVFRSLDYLKGPGKFTLGYDWDGHTVKTTIDLSRLLFDAPKDLKTLLPTHFDRSGRVVRFEDATMGGIFPDGDFVSKFNSVRYFDYWMTSYGYSSFDSLMNISVSTGQ